jgi:hypothetical protein
MMICFRANLNKILQCNCILILVQVPFISVYIDDIDTIVINPDNNNVKWDKIKYLQSSNSIVLKGYLYIWHWILISFQFISNDILFLFTKKVNNSILIINILSTLWGTTRWIDKSSNIHAKANSFVSI